jgi:hypothetical protein
MCKWFDKHFKLVINEGSDIGSQHSRKMEMRGPDYNCLQFHMHRLKRSVDYLIRYKMWVRNVHSVLVFHLVSYYVPTFNHRGRLKGSPSYS